MEEAGILKLRNTTVKKKLVSLYSGTTVYIWY